MPNDREQIFRGHIINVVRLDRHWEIVEHPDAVAILVRDGSRILGVRQTRPAIGLQTWELPAGLIDPGETPQQAARRELAEEANLEGDLRLLARSFSSPGFTDECVYLFEATGVAFAAGTPDPGESLSVEWRDVAELWAEMLAGELATSTTTLLGLHVAQGDLAPQP